MGFRIFDLLFAVVLLLAAVAAVGAFYLVEPYPAVIVAAFAAGAATFLYLTIRVKLGGIIGTVDRRLEEQELEASKHRAALEKSFADIENLTRSMREQIGAAGEQNAADVEALRKNVNSLVKQYNERLEVAVAALNELKQSHDKHASAFAEKLAALEGNHNEAAETLVVIRDEFNSFVADERKFREDIDSRLEERVAYLEDFIREKRKSLQI
jgi:septal ring factor EnvC (AmiA/AmiB activator)